MSFQLTPWGLPYPIIQAPMAGGPTTPELVAAVSSAGGLGSLGAAYLSPDQIVEAARAIRRITDRPFNVNLFCGGYQAVSHDLTPMLVLLAAAHARLGLPPPVAPEPGPDPFPEQLDAVLEVRPAVFSFTFGVPLRDTLDRLKARGISVWGTATTVEEARFLEAAGVDGIVAQGSEAGGHRGTFLGSFEESMVPALELLQATVAAVERPVIAAGGLMDGRDVARAIALGASAAQLGTAFLACPESGAPAAHKRALLQARSDTTVVTRAFSGRPARGLMNTFIEMLIGREADILPYPLQNLLTRPMRQAAARRGEAGFLSLWAGQGAPRCRELPAADLVAALVSEMGQSGPGR